MTWTKQKKNMGKNIKLIVWYTADQPRAVDTFHAFLEEEQKGKAIAGLTKRILNGHARGRYKTAIFYNNGVEVERWNDGIKVTTQN